MNAKTVGLLILLLVLGVGTSWGQFNAVFCSIETVLTDSCGGGSPLPDGQTVFIYWDQDNDGPDDSDPQPPVGDCFACCNFNIFPMNGEMLLGVPGTFCTDPAFTISTTTPQPSRYYLRVPVCERGIRWTSSVFTVQNGLNDYFVEGWTCGPCRELAIATCTATTNLDDRVTITWSDVDQETGYEILRSEASHSPRFGVIDSTVANAASYDDFTANPGQEYLYKVRAFGSFYGVGPESPIVRGMRAPFEPIVFGEVIVTTNISGVMSAEAADLDADGDMDVVAAGMFANKVAWYENNGSWGFTEHELITGWRGARAVDVGDIDDDGELDIVAVAKFENALIWWNKVEWGYWMRPISSSVMGAIDVEIASPMGGVSFMTAAADAGEITTWSFQDDAGFLRTTFARNLPGIRSLSAQWFPNPHSMYIYASSPTTGEISEWMSLTGYERLSVGIFDGVTACGAAQLNIETDDVHDVFFCTDESVLGWWDREGEEMHVISSLVESPRDVTSTLIDDDTRNDLLLASGHEISWWRNTRNRFYRNVICDNLPQASVVRGLDADGDGDTDVLCAGDNEIRFYLSTLNDTLDNVALAKQPEPDDNRISSLPSEFALLANYPNPFNATTEISFDLPREMQASLKVYDVLGREVAELVNGVMNAGSHKVMFDASALSSGVYFYRLEAGKFVETKKMVLLK